MEQVTTLFYVPVGWWRRRWTCFVKEALPHTRYNRLFSGQLLSWRVMHLRLQQQTCSTHVAFQQFCQAAYPYAAYGYAACMTLYAMLILMHGMLHTAVHCTYWSASASQDGLMSQGTVQLGYGYDMLQCLCRKPLHLRCQLWLHGWIKS